MPELLSPDQTRRPGVEAVPVVLADGQAWGLALPSDRIRPVIVEGVDPFGRPSKTVRVESERGYPPEIRRLIEALRSSCEQGSVTRQYESLIQLAVALIRRAHEIDPSDALVLLEIGLIDLPPLVEAVLSVVSGTGPAEPTRSRKSPVDG